MQHIPQSVKHSCLICRVWITEQRVGCCPTTNPFTATQLCDKIFFLTLTPHTKLWHSSDSVKHLLVQSRQEIIHYKVIYQYQHNVTSQPMGRCDVVLGQEPSGVQTLCWPPFCLPRIDLSEINVSSTWSECTCKTGSSKTSFMIQCNAINQHKRPNHKAD